MTPLDAETQRLLKLAEGATPGPWGVTGAYRDDPRGYYPIAHCGNGMNDEKVGVEAPVQDYCVAAENDAALIAAVPDMIQHIRALSERLARVEAEERERCAKVCDEYPQRDPAEDGNGYWAAKECSAAIRALKTDA